MRNIVNILFCFLISCSIGNAQSIKRNVISSFGASASISNTILESSFGQPSNIGTVTDSNNFIRQGFQQPLYQPQTPCSIAVLDTQNITCYGGNDGYIQVQGIGGSGLFHYSLQIYDSTFGFWYQIAQSPLTGFTYAPVTFSFLYADCYKIIMTDNYSCTDTIDICLTEPAEIITNNNVSSCDSYDWDGVTYYSSGIYTNVYTNADGCDSTVNVDLTITSCPGCTDSLANNYNPFATIDDSTCLYSPFIFGCTDSTALNYDPLATVDDSSCCYSSGQLWSQIGQDIDGEAAGDWSGHSVSASANGLIVAIGAPGNDENGNRSGHVRIYENVGGSWIQIGQDIDGESSSDGSGTSVSLSNDGSIVAIGARGNYGNGMNSGHVRVYENIGGSWVQIGQDIDGENISDESGGSICLNSDGTVVAIGAGDNDGNGNQSGHVRVYENNSGTWTQIGQDIDGEAAGDYSGNSVSLSSDGSIVAIGAYYNDGSGLNSGHVRIYENLGGYWSQIGQDIDGEAAGDYSGNSVSLSSDGSIVAVGAPGNDGNFIGSNTSTFPGHVRVYENIGGLWVQIGQDIDGNDVNEYSGNSVSLNSNGNVVSISSGLMTNSGHISIYENISGSWIQKGQDIYDLTNYFQNSVSLNSDGEIVVIGTPGFNGNGNESGHVRILEFSSSTPCSDLGCLDPLALNFDPYATVDDSSCIYPIYGCIDSSASNYNSLANISDSSCTYCYANADIIPDTIYACDSVEICVDTIVGGTYSWISSNYSSQIWTQLGLDIDGDYPGENFGHSVSMSYNGSIIAVGIPYNDENGQNNGQVRIYENINGLWVQKGGDINGGGYPFNLSYHNFGYSVSLSNDGNIIAIGAPGGGYVEIYDWNGSTWNQLGSQIIYNGSWDDDYGRSVSISSDGLTLAVGVPEGDGNVNNSGFVRVYNYDGNSWIELGNDLDGDVAGDDCGYSVSLSSDGNTVAIGAKGNNGNGQLINGSSSRTGQVRVYNWNGSSWFQLGQDIDGEYSGDESGWSVSLSSDGNTVAIGAPFNDEYISGVASGHVRIYNYNGGWNQIGNDIDGSSPIGQPSPDQFGHQVSISSDGNTVVIGAFQGSPILPGYSSVYKNIAGNWVQIGQDIDGEAVDDRSCKVSISGDGSKLAVGAINNDGSFPNAGHVRVFNRSFQTSNCIWVSNSGLNYITVTDSLGCTSTDSVYIDLVPCEIYGCTDSTSINFDPYATVDDSSCVYDVFGCTDSLASNYNPFATIDNGTCLYSSFVFGCTDTSALNYDPLATVDDSSCCYNANETWLQLGNDIDGGVGDFSGNCVSFSDDGNIMAVGARLSSLAKGKVKVYTWDGNNWVQIGQDIYGEDNGDESGYYVSLNFDGSILAVGASKNDANGAESGHVRVFENISGTWTQIGQDIDGEYIGDYSGSSISINNIGNILAISAPNNDGNGYNSGHVRVYENISGNWTQIGQDIDGENSSDYSGWSVSLSANGNTVAIGAYGNGNTYTGGLAPAYGHVRIYENISGTWVQIGQDIDGTSYGSWSGFSISLSDDGNSIAIGATGSSLVRIYELIGSLWIQKGQDIVDLSNGINIGYSVSIDNNANTVALSCANNTGLVKVYDFSSNQWTQTAQTIFGEALYDLSGYSISLTSQGKKIAIGAPQNVNNNSSSGHVRVYTLTPPCSDLGCLDPLALNFDPYATVDDSTCIYPNYGCIDSLASNYNQLANISDSSCTYCYANADIIADTIYACDSVEICVDTIVGGSYSWLTSNNSSNLAIGDSIQGGIIFYLDGNGGGLVVSQEIGNASWGCYGTNIIGADSTSIGSGSQNTIDIEAGCTTTGTAADICANLNLAGYDDWFLPSKDELHQLFLNSIGTGISFPYNYTLWSSSEGDATGAWLQIFIGGWGNNGNQQNGSKGNIYPVRAVRSFTYLSSDTSNCISVSNSDWNYITVTDSLGCADTDSVYVDITPCYIYGCTDPLACNYDSTATLDDGSCLTIYGCTDSLAFNYDSLAVCDDGSCIPIIYGCTDSSAVNYYAGANTDDGSCIYAGCTDSLASNYDSLATIDDGSCTYLQLGCTDSLACNYDPLALIDDSTCFLNYGCTDPNALNYDSLANCEDFSCIYPVYGCTDPNAINYYLGANVDDGSCLYAGCTDTLACNYDSIAFFDDGSCLTDYGCTDSLALNYDSTATCDDGSCIYVNPCNSPKPTGLYAYDIIDTRAKVGWDNMNDSNCMVWKYFVRYREVGTSQWTTKSAGVGNGLCNFGLNTITKQLLNLSPSTTYEFKMKAFYCGGTSSNYSPPSQFTTADVCPDMINLTPTTFNGNQSKVRFDWDTTGAYVFARILLRVDTTGAAWQTAGGFGVYYPTFFVNKFGLQSGQSYRAQGRTFCDSNITAYRSPTWTAPIFWTQPGSIRLNGGSSINNLEIFPNPSRDVFNISFTSDEIQDLGIRIINTIGAEVYREERKEFIGEYTKQINLDNYGKGIYFLEIETNSGIVNKKLILQ